MKISRISIVLIFVYLFLPSQSFATTKKALLIGINDYLNLPYYSNTIKETITDLQGPVNDVNSMREMLLSKYGFLDENIKVLLDKEATRKNILKALENFLVQGTQPGDLAFFFFSGHGTQLHDINGDEADGFDEALSCYESDARVYKPLNESGFIIDDELGVIFRQLQGRDVVVFVDACHSESVATRSIHGKPVSRLEKTSLIHAKFMPIEYSQPFRSMRSRSAGVSKQIDIPESMVFISSSKENQVSVEVSGMDGFHGALTSALIAGIKKNKDATYGELYQYVKKRIQDKVNLEQEPQIEPQSSPILARQLFVPTR